MANAGIFWKCFVVLLGLLSANPALSQEMRLKPFDSSIFDGKSNNLPIKLDQPSAPTLEPGKLQLQPLNSSLEMQKPRRPNMVMYLNEADILSNTLNGPSLPDYAEVHYHKPVGEYATVKTADDIKMMKTLLYGSAEAKSEAVKIVLANPSKFTPPILFAISKNLMEQGKSEDAVFWYFAGYLRARYDAYRCADVSARQGLIALIGTFAPLQFFRENTSKLEAEFMQRVIEWDKKTPCEYDYRWINMHGMDAFGDKSAPMSVPKSEWTAIQDQNRKSFLNDFTGIISQLKSAAAGGVTSDQSSTRGR